MIIEIMLE